MNVKPLPLPGGHTLQSSVESGDSGRKGIADLWAGGMSHTQGFAQAADTADFRQTGARDGGIVYGQSSQRGEKSVGFANMDNP